MSNWAVKNTTKLTHHMKDPKKYFCNTCMGIMGMLFSGGTLTFSATFLLEGEGHRAYMHVYTLYTCRGVGEGQL